MEHRHSLSNLDAVLHSSADSEDVESDECLHLQLVDRQRKLASPPLDRKTFTKSNCMPSNLKALLQISLEAFAASSLISPCSPFDFRSENIRGVPDRLYKLPIDMSTRKIKLSQKLTLRFRDISMPDESGIADLLNEDPEPSSSAETTFDSLPDLVPNIFQSQTEPLALDVTYLVSDCSMYKLWESCATDVIPLASQNEVTEHWPPNVMHSRGPSPPVDSQNEEAERWLITGTQTTEANHSESSDDAHKNLKTHDRDSVIEVTKTGVRENLRRVQAFSPHTSILFVEKDHDLGLPVREIAHDDMACDAVEELGRLPSPFDIDADTNEIDSYLILEEDAAKETPFDEPRDADETGENSRPFSTDEAPNGLETVEKHADVKKQSTRRKSLNQASDFPNQYTKQKRSTPKRRDQPSVSINLVRKLNWLSNTEHDHLGGDQGAQVIASIVDNKEITISKARKTRKTVPVASTISSKPPASQPRGRRGRKKNLLRSSASLNGEE